MKNLKMTALFAGALAGALVLGGAGVATASMMSGTPTTPGSTYWGSMMTTPPTDVTTPPVDVTTPPSDVTTPPVTPPGEITTPPVTPPSGVTTPPVCPTPKATITPMPSQAMGNAYGRTISHPHQGLHRGRGYRRSMSGMRSAGMMGR